MSLSPMWPSRVETPGYGCWYRVDGRYVKLPSKPEVALSAVSSLLERQGRLYVFARTPFREVLFFGSSHDGSSVGRCDRGFWMYRFTENTTSDRHADPCYGTNAKIDLVRQTVQTEVAERVRGLTIKGLVRLAGPRSPAMLLSL